MTAPVLQSRMDQTRISAVKATSRQPKIPSHAVSTVTSTLVQTLSLMVERRAVLIAASSTGSKDPQKDVLSADTIVAWMFSWKAVLKADMMAVLWVGK